MDSDVIYYLYIKTHNVSGLKYLGITKQDPYEYQGSGIIWKNHLKKYGRDISTTILGTYTNKDDLGKAGLYYSNKYNIVESKDFANITIEEGQGGNTWDRSIKENREKMRVRKRDTRNMKRPKSAEHKEKLAAHLRKLNRSRVRTPEEIKRLSDTQKQSRTKCPNCDFESTLSHVKRHLKRNVCGPIKEIN
jgi:hypothetical protein